MLLAVLPAGYEKQWNIVPNIVAAKYMCCKRHTLKVMTLPLQTKEEKLLRDFLSTYTKHFYLHGRDRRWVSLHRTARPNKGNTHGTLFVVTVQWEASLWGVRPGISPITDQWMEHWLEDKHLLCALFIWSLDFTACQPFQGDKPFQKCL